MEAPSRKIQSDSITNKKLIEGEPFFSWRLASFILDLLDKDGNFLQYESFRNKYSLTSSNFLRYFQVVKSILKHLLNKAKTMKVPPQRSCIVSTSTLFQLAESAELKLTEMKTKRLLLASYRKDLHGEINGFEKMG